MYFKDTHDVFSSGADEFNIPHLDEKDIVELSSRKLMLAEAISIDSWKATNSSHYRYQEVIKFRVYREDNTSFTIRKRLPLGSCSGLVVGEYVRVLYASDDDIVFETSYDYNHYYVKYTIDASTEILAHGNSKPNRLKPRESFTYTSKALHELKHLAMLSILVITCSIILLVIALYGDAFDKVTSYALFMWAVVACAYAIEYQYSKYLEERTVIHTGDIKTVEVVDVCSDSVFVDVDGVCYPIYTSRCREPNISKGDYIRVLFNGSNILVAEGDQAKGKFIKVK